MHNLAALSYKNESDEEELASALSQVKNLKHLDFRPSSSGLSLDALPLYFGARRPPFAA